MLNLKVVMPDYFAVAAQPDEADLPLLAQKGYKTLISNRPDHESPGQPKANDIQAAAKQQGLHYVHIPVAADSINRQDIDAFREALDSGPAPVVAHCGSGKRSYLLWAAGEVLYKGRTERELIQQAETLGLDASALPEIVARNS